MSAGVHSASNDASVGWPTVHLVAATRLLPSGGAVHAAPPGGTGPVMGS